MKQFLAVMILSLLCAASCVGVQKAKKHRKTGHRRHSGHVAVAELVHSSVSRVLARTSCRNAANALRHLPAKVTVQTVTHTVALVAACATRLGKKAYARRLRKLRLRARKAKAVRRRKVLKRLRRRARRVSRKVRRARRARRSHKKAKRVRRARRSAGHSLAAFFRRVVAAFH